MPRKSNDTKSPFRRKQPRVVRVTPAQARRMKDRTDHARLEALTERDIAREIADDPDTVEFTDEMLERATWMEPDRKELISVRLDQSVLKYFRASGPGVSGRINAVLRSYVNAQRARHRPRAGTKTR